MPTEEKEAAYILRRLATCSLFVGFSLRAVQELLPLLEAKMVCYSKGERVMSYGDPARAGLVLEGLMTASQEIYGEALHIVEILESDDLFCIDAVYSGEKTSYTDLTAECDCRILFFSLDGLFHNISEGSRNRLWQNISLLLANRCIRLLYKTEVLSAKSLRNQIMTFFHILQRKYGSNSFRIKMSRQQLAQYLCVNRSALSRELNRMQRDGLIQLGKDGRITMINGSQFLIKTPVQTGSTTEYETGAKTTG